MTANQYGTGNWRLIYANYKGWRCRNPRQLPPATTKQDFDQFEDARRALDALRAVHGGDLVGTVIPIPAPRARLSGGAQGNHLTNLGWPLQRKPPNP